MSHKQQKPVSQIAPVLESHTATPSQPERQTKQALLLELIRREGGATLEELTSATGWLPHTARAAVTGLRKRGHAIRRDRAEGVSRYFVGSNGQCPQSVADIRMNRQRWATRQLGRGRASAYA